MPRIRNNSVLNPHKSELLRGKWKNKIEFILSCSGYAIGLGNVWRFPYLCYQNGGGAFLVPYLLMLGISGIPLFFMETTLGQFGSTGCVTVFRICPLFKGVGYAIVIVNIVCTMYYSVLISYPLLFLVSLLRSKLPWVDCTNNWNTENCLELGRNRTSLHLNMTRMTKTPADEFFNKHILKISDGIDQPGGIVWPLFLCNVVAWTIAYLCIMNGVKSVAKVTKYTATFPFILLLVLLIRGITLPGAWNGIVFYIYPDWKQLTNLKVWADAAIQIFFSLGPGGGTIIIMASYNQFGNNNKMDSIIVPLLNCGTSIFAGFVVFAVLGFMAHETSQPVSTVATGGPGLVFVTYPEAISMLPIPHLWAALFFIMLFLLGLDSCFVQMETIISSVVDEFPQWRSRKKLLGFLICFGMFLGSISCLTNGGMYVLQLLDWYAVSISVILICLTEVIVVNWIYGQKQFVKDLEFMIKNKVHWWWPLNWKYITPVFLALQIAPCPWWCMIILLLVSVIEAAFSPDGLFVYFVDFIFVTTICFHTPITYNGIIYPQWALAIGWLSCGASIICIPLYIIYKLYITPGTFKKRLKLSLQATSEWAPAEEEDRRAWYALNEDVEDELLNEIL